MAVGINEGRPVDAIVAWPSDLEAGVGFLEGDGFRVAVAGETCGEVIGRVEEPGIADFVTDRTKPSYIRVVRPA